MTQNPFRSWALWLAIASLIAFVVKQFFDIDLNPFFDGLADVLLPVLIGFGVVNNPTAKGSLWGNNNENK